MRETEPGATTTYVTEPEKQVPIVHDVDVLVAGAGVSGVFAAIAAARNGARTAIVDRFGNVGGNIGPGVIAGGGMLSGRSHPDAGYNNSVYPELYGIGREFIDRYAALGGGSLPPYMPGPPSYVHNASVATYVAQTMLEESGVKTLLSTQVADPILDGARVRGLFVENKSGRRAVTANVVVDATGEADVARRAGGPILYPKTAYHEIDGHAPNGMGLHYCVGGVDWERYDAALKGTVVPDEDVAWATETLGEQHAQAYRSYLPFMRQAHDGGDLALNGFVRLGDARVPVFVLGVRKSGTPGAIHGRARPEHVEEIDAGNGLHISALEAGLRTHLFEMIRFWQKYMPGFEKSCILNVAPFLGARGGPCIEGEYTLTMDDCMVGRRFDDVMYIYGEARAISRTCKQGDCRWVDVPYRVMVPKEIDGLLATGRCASCIPDTLLRNRMAVKVMGEACGIAAAMAAMTGVAPRDLDVRELQEALLGAGFHLGNRARLRDLRLA